MEDDGKFKAFSSKKPVFTGFFMFEIRFAVSKRRENLTFHKSEAGLLLCFSAFFDKSAPAALFENFV